MHAFVGVTDGDWYQFLAARPTLTEVNFWLPGGRSFRALQSGEPFVFKSHYPSNRLVGGGIFAGSVALHVSDAWRIYAEANGVASHEDLVAKIAAYRRRGSGGDSALDPQIGCVLLTDVRFFAPLEQLAGPADFARNIVAGKRYLLDEIDSQHSVWLAAMQVLGWNISTLGASSEVFGPVFGEPVEVAKRRGQRAFQALVLDSYAERCAITGDRIRPVLEAAHIVPVAMGGLNRVDNGLLLRSDAHTLFDRGYLGVDHRYRLRVSPLLRQQFGNGEEFYARAGEPIGLPERRAARPHRDALEWHNDVVFRGS